MTDHEPRAQPLPRRDEPTGRAAAQPPRGPSKPRAGWVVGGALGAFFAALALLAFQVRAGQDPALGAPQPVAQAQKPKPRSILVRKVIRRVVVHHPPAASGGSAPAPSGGSAPVQTSAPTSSAPAPAPAPPPAPAPAPLTTQSS